MFRVFPLLGVMLLAQAPPQSCDLPAGILITPLDEGVPESAAPGEGAPQDRPAPDVGGDATVNGPPRERGIIRGHVFGILPEQPEVPLAGALVQLRRGEELLREVSTGDEGQYEITDVPPGEYGMVAWAEGFEPQHGPVHVPPRQVVVRDFHLRPALPPGVIEGRVLRFVPDQPPAPLPGALLLLLQGDHIVRQAHSDPGGHYVLPEVPPGVFVMLVQAEGFEPVAGLVPVEPEHVTFREFVLHELLPPGAVVGRVLGATPEGEVPLAGALVTLHRGPHLFREVRTHEDGHFEMSAVPPGEYLLMARARDFQPAEAPILVKPAQMTEHVFVLEPRE